MLVQLEEDGQKGQTKIAAVNLQTVWKVTQGRAVGIHGGPVTDIHFVNGQTFAAVGDFSTVLGKLGA